MNLSPITILIADDDPDDQLLIHDALVQNRIFNEMHFVSDGQELMDYLLTSGRQHAAALPAAT